MNVVPIRPAVPDGELVTARNAYSFDMTQPDQRGMVLIDACVPMSVALQFLELLSRSQKS